MRMNREAAAWQYTVISFRACASPSPDSAKYFRSPPALKNLPRPVSRAARMPGSSSQRMAACISSLPEVMMSPFAASGRFRVMMAT